MRNYNKFIYQFKAFSVNFSSKIAKDLGRVETKFISSMIYGVIKSQSTKLSDIARALKESISLKDTVDRLSRNLENIYKFLPTIWNNHHDSLKPRIKAGTYIHLDPSDVIKEYGKKFEDLCRVADGSDDHKVKNGYWVIEITALVNDRVVSLYSSIFSTLTKGFLSVNDEIFKALDIIYKSFGNLTTIVIDRGFDDEKFFKYFAQKSWDFIIRVKHTNRIVSWNGTKIKIDELSSKFKGKYNIKIKLKGKFYDAKCSFAKILVPGITKELTVIFVYYDKSVSMFITNKDILGKGTCLNIVYQYYKRWRIEEFIRCKKEQFNFEDYRVRSLNKMNSLNVLLTLAISSLELLACNKTKLLNAILIEAKSIKSKVFFEYYRIAMGIKEILGHTVTGIATFFRSETSQQLAFEFD